MKITFTGPSGTGKTTLRDFLATTFNLPVNPVGARSVAKDMGFERTYDVDRACGYCYVLEPRDRLGFAETRETFTHAEYALMCKPGEIGSCGRTDRTVRPLFQTKLAEAKIAWETSCASFVADRTPLDDLAYAMMHCPEVVTAEFRDRAFAHMRTYDLIFYTPLSTGQWLNSDPSRVAAAADPLYHWRFDTILRGLLAEARGRFAEARDLLPLRLLNMPGLGDRQDYLRETLIRWKRTR